MNRDMYWDGIWSSSGVVKVTIKMEHGRHAVTIFGASAASKGAMDLKFNVRTYKVEVRGYTATNT